MKYKGMNVWLTSNIVTFLMDKKEDGEKLVDTLHRVLGVNMPPQRVTREPEVDSKLLYDLTGLSIGEDKTIPWRRDEAGQPIDQRPIHNAIKRYAERSGREFKSDYLGYGVRVTRIK